MNEDNERDLIQYDMGAEHDAEPPIESQVVQNKSLSRKIAGALLSDTYQLVLGNIYREIIDPAIRRLAVEAFKALVYRGKNSSSISDEYTPYDTLYDRSGPSENRIKSDFGDVKFRTQESADKVINIMRGIIRKNGLVRVVDYYKIVKRKPAYSYVNYGWTNLDSAYAYGYKSNGERVWSIHFPEPMYIESN